MRLAAADQGAQGKATRLFPLHVFEFAIAHLDRETGVFGDAGVGGVRPSAQRRLDQRLEKVFVGGGHEPVMGNDKGAGKETGALKAVCRSPGAISRGRWAGGR